MPVKSSLSYGNLPVDPNNNWATFGGFVRDIPVAGTTVTTTFYAKVVSPPSDAFTRIEWIRGAGESFTGQKYHIYRCPLPTVLRNETQSWSSLEYTNPSLFKEITDPAGLDYDVTSFDYLVPENVQGWYFYLLVIKYQGLIQKVSPRFSVWESTIGPNSAQAPVLISAEPGNARVTLVWTPIADAVGYKVFFAEEEATDKWASSFKQWKPNGQEYVAGTEISTIVTGLSNEGVTYWFRIRALTDAGDEGPFSNELNAVPFSDTTPPDPLEHANFTVEDLGIGGTIRVCWGMGGYTPPDDIKSFRVYYKKTDLFSVITESDIIMFADVPYAVGAQCINVSDLEDNERYWFTVIPLDESGNYESGANQPIIVKSAVPTRPTQIGYSDTITLTVNNPVRGVTGVPAPHVIYGLVNLPVESQGQISLFGMEILITVTLSALGNVTETLKVYTDEDGFWHVNLGNLTTAEWRNNDYIGLVAKDWNSPFIGTESARVDDSVGAQRIDIFLEDSSLRPPVLLSPVTGRVSEYPAFRLYSTTQDVNMRFKIEVSDDNFRTITRVFDETLVPLGWSRERNNNNLIAIYRTFQDDRLVNGETYQWRAYVYNGLRFSAPSNIAQFSVVAEQLDKVSDTWDFNVSAPSLVELVAINTDIGRFEGPREANGATITDSTPTLEWRLMDITVNNVHFRLEIDTASTFDGDSLRVLESKDDPVGFEYSLDGRSWTPFSMTGAPPGVQMFRYVFTRNLEVV